MAKRKCGDYPDGMWTAFPPVTYVCLTFVTLGIALIAVNVGELQRMQQEGCLDVTSSAGSAGLADRQPKLWVTGRNVDSGYLRHVLDVFQRVGYVRGTEDDFDVMWAHDYPFRVYNQTMMSLREHQKVNHFPGSGFITSKVELSTSAVKHVPRAFKIPQETDQLLQYAAENPDKMFVQKSNSHRNIRIRSLQDLDLKSNGTFVQQYIDRPLLIDGHKFDIGVYTVMTSIDPLRVYIYWGDVLLRFCPEQYHPFDPALLDKYVVGDDYLPVWKVPSLVRYHDTLKLGHRESLNTFLRAQGQDPDRIWRQIEESIRSVYLTKESRMVRSAARFRSKIRQFFEMVRFDFVVDDELNVYLMEANMSPNLSSAHFRQNRLLYEQVVYNLLALVGVSSRLQPDLARLQTGPVAEMQAAEKDIAVFGQECGSAACQGSCSGVCRVCHPCLSRADRAVLKQALMEHLSKHLSRRVLPRPMSREEAGLGLAGLEDLTPSNQLMHLWFRGKCLLDASWC